MSVASIRQETDAINTANINHSYVMGYDRNTGWDGFYYFTYFGQFQRHNDGLAVVEITFIVLLSVAVILANVLVLTIMLTMKSASNANGYFLANMSLAALVYPFGMPLIAVTRIKETWIFGQAACSMVPFTEFCAAMVSVWTMTLISIERRRVTRRKRPFQKKQVLIMVAVLWLLGAAYSVPLGRFFVLKESYVAANEPVVVCTLVWPNNDVRMSYAFLVPCVMLAFVLPLLIIAVNYAYVTKTLNESMEKLHEHRTGSQVRGTRSGIFNWKLFRHRKEANLVRFLVVLVAVFCTMWMPIAVCLIMIVYDKATSHLIMTSEVFIAGECFALSNSLVNPLIYAFINERYRNGLNNMLSKIRRVSIKRNNIAPEMRQNSN